MLLGIKYKRQLAVPVVYKGITIRDPLFIDILVEDEVIVEVKAVEKNHPIYETKSSYVSQTNWQEARISYSPYARIFCF